MNYNVAFLQFVLAIHGQSQLWNSFPINSIASCGWCWGITLVWLDGLASAACLPSKCPALHIPEGLPAPGAMAAATRRLLSHAGRQSQCWRGDVALLCMQALLGSFCPLRKLFCLLNLVCGLEH